VPVLFIDEETYSEVPIKYGTHRYAENSEIILFGYAWDDDPHQVYEGMPGNLEEMFNAADEIVIQNSFFDRTNLAYKGIKIPIEKITDTMVLALAHGYPAGLDQMCEALDVPVDKAKKKDGKKLINLFCKPRPKKQKLRRATKETHPKEWAEFVDYCGFDIVSMRECWKRLPRWNFQPFERKLWYLDQKINDRGVAIDLDLAAAALRAAERAGQVLAAESDEMTDGAVKSTTQRDVLMAYLNNELSFEITDLKKGTIKNILKKGQLEPGVKEILENRLQAAATSPAKYKVLLNSTSLSDGRLRGTLQFCGAGRTSRWGGRLFQPQNLPRPTLEQAMIELGILAMKANCEDLIFDNVMELCSSAVRGAIIAPDGKKLSISDLSNIEGRVSAWVAGEDWKVKAFAELDAGRGVDIYVLAYSRAFGVPVETVLANKKTGDGMMRQIGKVMELALGYGGAVGAFASMALLYGIELPEDEIVEIVQKWRKAHPAIKRYWYDLEWAIRQAYRNPGESFKAGPVTADRVGHTVRLKMPSGSYLCYPHFSEGIGEDNQCSYMGINQYTRKWERIRSYGPKFFENVVQKISRDILGRGMIKAEKTGFEMVLHVHDELVAESREDDEDLTHAQLSKILATNPPWALNLPLAAAGHDTYRYAKE